MSIADTGKEIVRIGATAGLAKDVIDLLESKVAILTKEIDLLRGKRILSLDGLTQFCTRV